MVTENPTRVNSPSYSFQKLKGYYTQALLRQRGWRRVTLQPPFSLRMMPPLQKRRWLYGPPLKRKILKGTTALSPCHHKPMRQRAQKLHSSAPRQSGPWVGSTRKLLIWGYLFTFSLSTSVYHLQTTKPWCQPFVGSLLPSGLHLICVFIWFHLIREIRKWMGAHKSPEPL